MQGPLQALRVPEVPRGLQRVDRPPFGPLAASHHERADHLVPHAVDAPERIGIVPTVADERGEVREDLLVRPAEPVGVHQRQPGPVRRLAVGGLGDRDRLLTQLDRPVHPSLEPRGQRGGTEDVGGLGMVRGHALGELLPPIR